METSLGLLLMLISLAIIHIVQAQDQTGFISLDCGLPANVPSPYVEANTGLKFTSDEGFIQSGKTGRVQANLEGTFLQPYTTLRYFPDETRSCYNLVVEKDQIYLIRAFFVYGNYDGRNITPKFDLYLGPNPWTTVDLQGFARDRTYEILHIPTENSLQICLLKTGATVPLISTLELRPMGNGTYITKSGSLKSLFRRYVSNSSSYQRFPYDLYDRIWIAHNQMEWTLVSTTSDVVNSNKHKPPKVVLTTAATPTNISEPLTFEWTPNNPDDQYYFYIHLAEIQDIQDKNDTREFNILLNGELLFHTLTPGKLAVTTTFSNSPSTCKGGVKCSLQLIRTNRSTLPPLLNAFEVYTVIQFPQSETDENDVDAIKSIATTYGLRRIDWQGDPCFPLQLRWDALNCSNEDISTPPRTLL